MARRRMGSLQGDPFGRRAMKIRSEDSAPALIRPHGFGGNLGLFIPDVFRFGRAGNGRYRLRRWRSWVTAGSARTRQGTLGSLDSPFAAAFLNRGLFQNIHRSAHSYQQGQLFDKTRMGLVFWSLLC